MGCGFQEQNQLQTAVAARTGERALSVVWCIPAVAARTGGRALSVVWCIPTQDLLKFKESKRIERARSAREILVYI